MTNPPLNALQAQAHSLPTLLKEQFAPLEARSRTLLPTATLFAIRRVLLSGCGDSQIVAALLSAEWRARSGIPTHALNAMQAARYEPQLAATSRHPQDPLLLAISISGEVARTVEAAEQWAARGATVVALTANPESRLAHTTPHVYQLDLPPFVSAPGLRSFFLAAQAIQLLALRFGEVRGRFTQEQAAQQRADWLSAAAVLAAALPDLDKDMKARAEKWQGLPRYELLGSGTERAAAAFGAAKLLEASGVSAQHQDIEEWLHLNYFAKDPAECGTWLLASANDPAFSRAQELAAVLRRLGRPHCLLTDGRGAEKWEGAADTVIALPAMMGAFRPLLLCAALALFAAHLSELQGAEYGRGARGPWRDSEEGGTTRRSLRLPLPPERGG